MKGLTKLSQLIGKCRIQETKTIWKPNWVGKLKVNVQDDLVLSKNQCRQGGEWFEWLGLTKWPTFPLPTTTLQLFLWNILIKFYNIQDLTLFNMPTKPAENPNQNVSITTGWKIFQQRKGRSQRIQEEKTKCYPREERFLAPKIKISTWNPALPL